MKQTERLCPDCGTLFPVTAAAKQKSKRKKPNRFCPNCFSVRRCALRSRQRQLARYKKFQPDGSMIRQRILHL